MEGEHYLDDCHACRGIGEGKWVQVFTAIYCSIPFSSCFSKTSNPCGILIRPIKNLALKHQRLSLRPMLSSTEKNHDSESLFNRVLQKRIFPGFSRPVSRGNRERKFTWRLRERERFKKTAFPKLVCFIFIYIEIYLNNSVLFSITILIHNL